MVILTEALVEKWRGRMLNIHPSLLPRHKGAHAVKAAIAAGDPHTGSTVHFVEARAPPYLLSSHT